MRFHDAAPSSSIFVWVPGWRTIRLAGWSSAGGVDEDCAGTVGDDSAGAVKGEGVSVEDEGVPVEDEGVGIRYVESIKRKLLHTSVQLVHPLRTSASSSQHTPSFGPPCARRVRFYICGLAISTIWGGERMPVGARHCKIMLN